MTSPGNQGPPRRPASSGLGADRLRTTGNLPPSAASGEVVLRRDVLETELNYAEQLLARVQPAVLKLQWAMDHGEADPTIHQRFLLGMPAAERAHLEATVPLLAIPANRRNAQIVLHQFQMAVQAYHAAGQILRQFITSNLTVGTVEDFSLTKLRGAMHPLLNYGLMFSGVPELATLFPAVDPPPPLATGTGPLPPPPPSDLDAMKQVAKQVLESPRVAPIVDRGMDLMKKAQEAAPGLKEMGLGLIKKVTGKLRPPEDGLPRQ